MKKYSEPLFLADMFDNSFKLIGKTFARTITVAAILIIPGSILLAVGLDWFYSTIGDFMMIEQNGEGMGIEQALKMFAGMFLLIPGGIVFAVAAAGAKTSCTLIVCSQISGKEISWNEALRQVFQLRVWRVLGQGFLEYGLYVSMILCVGFVMVVTAAASLKLGLLLMIVMMFSAAGVAIYCSIRWLFTLQAIVWDESGVMSSFGRSAQLVTNYWWRTFGIVLLFSLLVGFAESLISTPIMFLAMWNFYSSYFHSIASSGKESVDPAMVSQMMSSMGFALGIYIIFSTIFTMLIEPVYRSVMYFDLRARRGEFTERESSRPFASYFEQR